MPKCAAAALPALSSESALTLSPQLFAILSSLVEERCGLHYASDEAGIFGDKVTARAREAGFESLLDYYYFLRYDAAAAGELEALVEALVVGETYFFRELVPMRAGVEHVLVPAVAERGRARVWSVACATGEEPVSLAMLLEEAGIAAQCQIVATDISARALARAREGVYGARSLRLLPPQLPPQGFTQRTAAIVSQGIARDGTTARVDRRIVDSIDYRKVNVLDEAAMNALGTFDLVLCRNVLFYFADKTVSRVVTTLTRAIGDDGRLILGASESLLRFGTVLRYDERGGAFLYAKETR
jgi:chemotaxis protein methyltransferase CheR